MKNKNKNIRQNCDITFHHLKLLKCTIMLMLTRTIQDDFRWMIILLYFCYSWIMIHAKPWMDHIHLKTMGLIQWYSIFESVFLSLQQHKHKHSSWQIVTREKCFFFLRASFCELHSVSFILRASFCELHSANFILNWQNTTLNKW